MSDMQAQNESAFAKLPNDYIARVEAALSELPAQQRVAIRVHIVQMRTESAVRTYVCETLGVL